MDPLHKRMLARANTRARTDRWYEITNDAGPKATVRIYSEIGYFGVTAEDFASEIEAIAAPEIEVQINSPGGLVFDGIAIFNALRAHPARVTTRVDGIAASAASVIAQAGDHRVMVESAQMMIHEARGLVVGTAGEMREFAELLDKQSDVIAGIYANRSGGDAAKFRDLMAAETWLTDKEAIDNGLADEVYVPPRQDGAANKNALEERLAALEARFSPHKEEEPPGEHGVTEEAAALLLSALTFNKEQSHE